MSRAPLLPAVEPIEELQVLMLEVTSRCACRCVMCDVWRDSRIGPEMDPELLRSWLPGWHALRVRRIGLTGGDPLMHSEARTVLDLLGGEGFSITLMTAGAGLAVHAAEVARWCDSVVVSLDGPPAVHDAIRGLRGSFRILNEGVRTLRHQAGRDQRITARCTVQRHNSDQLVRTVEVARTMGLDGISFLPVDTSTASFGRAAAGGWDPKVRDLLPEVDRLKELASELEGVARASGSSGFVAEDLQALRDRILHHFEAEAGKQAPRARPCNAPWVSAVVGIDGVTSPCFFHPAYGVSDRGTELGAFINAPTARAFRRGLEVASDPVCRRCVCPLALRRGEDPR